MYGLNLVRKELLSRKKNEFITEDISIFASLQLCTIPKIGKYFQKLLKSSKHRLVWFGSEEGELN